MAGSSTAQDTDGVRQTIATSFTLYRVLFIYDLNFSTKY